MTFFIILLLFSLGYYGIVIVLLSNSITNAKSTNNNKTNDSVSIIVAVKNGELSLPNLLKDLTKQIYSGKLEIIIVDDESIDNTAEIISKMSRTDDRIIYESSLLGNPILSHKKRALDAGIKKSTGDILLFTDVDCRISPYWADTLSSNFIAGVDYVVGYTQAPKPLNRISLFQSIDFFMLISAANGAINRNWYWSSSGQNQGFRRDIYEKCNGYTEIAKYIQGDDSLFLQICRKKIENFSATFVINNHARMICRQETRLIPFILQRLRWAGDARHMWKFNPIFFLMIVATFLSNIFILFFFIFLPFNTVTFLYFLITITFKFIIEYILFKKGSMVFQQEFKTSEFFQWFLLQIPYVVIVGFGSFLNTMLPWRNRKAG